MMAMKWSVIQKFGLLEGMRLLFLLVLQKIKIIDICKNDLYKKYNNLIFLKERNINYHMRNRVTALCEENKPTIPFPIVIRVNDSDPMVLYQIYLKKEYEPLVDLYKTHFGNTPEVILDVGANIGLTSLYFGSHFPLSAIICLEPDEQNFRVLQENLRLSRLAHVTPLQHALWSSNQFLSMDRQFRDKQSWSLRVSQSQSVGASVQGVTIQKIIDDHNLSKIDILKIDIEGAEGEVFKDSKSTQEFLSKVKTIGLEIHDELVERNKIETVLLDAGFDFFEAGESIFGYNKNLVASSTKHVGSAN